MDTVKPDTKQGANFWLEYVSTARQGYGLKFDPADHLRGAINEWFGIIDEAVGEAKAIGCLFFHCTSPRKERFKIWLHFSDAGGNAFRRTLTVDGRFERRGRALKTDDLTDLKIAIQSMIINEGSVAPKGGTVGLIPR